MGHAQGRADALPGGAEIGRLLYAAAALIASGVGTTAAALERSPPQRQTLSDLAYVLGQSHALRQACRGPHDYYWRARMAALLKLEPVDRALGDRLTRSFDAGFQAGQAAYPRCTPATRAEAARVAGHGESLAAHLAAGIDPGRISRKG